ncbi:MAG: 50S ribosomal protein L24 [Candidatus Levybacteria bacterium]|nr:50S ribosomal protein L24 [Candidatus Levybacteria bacterium]
MKLKKGDIVAVVKGKDAGKSGKIMKVNASENSVVVENINQYKRHVKSRTQTKPSEIITITKPLPVANVAFLCPKCKKQTRIGYSIEKGEKNRICRKCNAKI